MSYLKFDKDKASWKIERELRDYARLYDKYKLIECELVRKQDELKKKIISDKRLIPLYEDLKGKFHRENCTIPIITYGYEVNNEDK